MSGMISQDYLLYSILNQHRTLLKLSKIPIKEVLRKIQTEKKHGTFDLLSISINSIMSVKDGDIESAFAEKPIFGQVQLSS